MEKIRKLKRVVIKEELVAVTGDFMLAIILNQFLYWAERAKDFDKMLIEEKAIAEREGIDLKTPLKCGWVYKKAEELIEETMLGISQTNMRSKVKSLIKMGFLSERNNPNYKWDRTKQYRVNFHILKRELEKQGYNLQGYKMLENGENIESQNLSFESQIEKDRTSKFEVQDSKSEVQDSKSEEQYQRLQTEITTNNKRENKKRKFVPPTVEEVKEYCGERNNNIDPEAFIAFYTSKGWKVGNQPMKDWKSAVITWEIRHKNDSKPKPKKSCAESQSFTVSDLKYNIFDDEEFENEESSHTTPIGSPRTDNDFWLGEMET